MTIREAALLLGLPVNTEATARVLSVPAVANALIEVQAGCSPEQAAALYHLPWTDAGVAWREVLALNQNEAPAP
jgi:hypothetical protein